MNFKDVGNLGSCVSFHGKSNGMKPAGTGKFLSLFSEGFRQPGKILGIEIIIGHFLISYV